MSPPSRVRPRHFRVTSQQQHAGLAKYRPARARLRRIFSRRARARAFLFFCLGQPERFGLRARTLELQEFPLPTLRAWMECKMNDLSILPAEFWGCCRGFACDLIWEKVRELRLARGKNGRDFEVYFRGNWSRNISNYRWIMTGFTFDPVDSSLTADACSVWSGLVVCLSVRPGT